MFVTHTFQRLDAAYFVLSEKRRCSNRQFPPALLDNEVCSSAPSSELTGGKISRMLLNSTNEPPVDLMTLLLSIFMLNTRNL
jgi:hypothetical protein